MSIKIELRKIVAAGAFDLVVCDNGITEDLRLCLSGGQPFECARRNAELLAVAIDCSMYLDGEIIRLAQKEENRSYRELKKE